MTDYDVIIVGAGAAGMTAAIYTCRKQLKTLVISRDVGGQTNQTNHIENYPGVDPQPGPQLMEKFKANAESFGAVFEYGGVTKVDKNKDNTFTLTIDDGTARTTRAVILSFGRNARRLNIPGEEQFWGRGVATCVTCDAPLFKGKVVAVVGAGNAAAEGALELAPLGSKVYLIHRSEKFRADEITVQKLKADKRVTIMLNKTPIEVKGDKFVTSITLKDTINGKTSDLPLDGIFLEIGSIVDSSAVAGLVSRNEQNEVIVDKNGNTSCPGIFAAGDVTPVKYKQTVISAGEGAVAALECHAWLTGQKGVH